MASPEPSRKKGPSRTASSASIGGGGGGGGSGPGSASHYHYSTFTNDLEAQDARRAALQASADRYKEEEGRGAFSRLGEMASRTSDSIADFFRGLLYRVSLACLPCFELVTIIMPGLTRSGGGNRGEANGDASAAAAAAEKSEYDDLENGVGSSKRKMRKKKGRSRGDLEGSNSCMSLVTHMEEEEDGSEGGGRASSSSKGGAVGKKLKNKSVSVEGDNRKRPLSGRGESLLLSFRMGDPAGFCLRHSHVSPEIESVITSFLPPFSSYGCISSAFHSLFFAPPYKEIQKKFRRRPFF